MENILSFFNSLGTSTLDEEFSQLFHEGVDDKNIFKAIFIQGPNLSGKDFIVNKILDIKSITEISTVKTFEYLFGKNKLDFSVPDQDPPAKTEIEFREKLALLGRNALLINGTSDIFDKIAMIKQALENIGYDTLVVMINIDDETAKQRNIERGQTGGRIVPEKNRKEKWDLFQDNRAKFAQLFTNNYLEFDNSADLRTADPQTAIQKQQELQQLMTNIQEFLDTDPTSDLAKNWIENEQIRNNPTDDQLAPPEPPKKKTVEELFTSLFDTKSALLENFGLSIKGSDSGLSMASSGESIARDSGEIIDKFTGNAGIKRGKQKVLKKESINADGIAIANSISAEKEDILNKKKVPLAKIKKYTGVSL